MIYILSSPVNSGKTTFLKKLYTKAKKNKKNVFALISEKESVRDSVYYYAFMNELKLGRAVEVVKNEGRIFLNDDIFSLVYYVVKKVLREEDFFIIDEAGPVELAGKGHFKTIKLLLKNDADFVVAVRKNLLSDFIDFFNLKYYLIAERFDMEFFERLWK
jgi:nucleoside-triphosphatase THEP1